MVTILFIGCIALLALGVPVAFALGGATLMAMASGHVPLVALPKYLFSGIDLFALEAVPFFILTAELMTGGELSAVLLRFASQFVGRFRGGMGHTNILTLTFFSGISGSALADAAGPGAIMIRMMRDDGYAPEYAAALTAATSILGPIIPPSISVIIYALAYPEVNLVGLLIAGDGSGNRDRRSRWRRSTTSSRCAAITAARRNVCNGATTCATRGARCPRSCCPC